jgi:neutral ceramidase
MARSRSRRWRYVFLLILVGAGVALYIESRPFTSYPSHTLAGQLQPPQLLPPPAQAEAGMAVVDITPPIGMPKFGYSAWAKDSDGFRTRLKARAFYLRASDGKPMALVQLDLGSGSLALHHVLTPARPIFSTAIFIMFSVPTGPVLIRCCSNFLPVASAML